MWNLLYFIIAFGGAYIRQFVLPNPFEQLGIISYVINFFISGIITVISYRIVGLFYEKGSAPFIGSLLFMFVYVVIYFEIFASFLLYPNAVLVAGAIIFFAVVDIIVINKLLNKL